MDSTVFALLSTLHASLESASQALPEEAEVLPPKDGISLLDVKNELFLSYVQNLVFLIIVKLRHASSSSGENSNTQQALAKAHDDVVKKLVELRLYLEKGVRPLEGRLKYQVDKVVRAAEEAERASKVDLSKAKVNGTHKQKGRKQQEGSEESDAVEQEDESDSVQEVDELSYRPNPSALMRPNVGSDKRKDAEEAKPDDIYRPPRIAPTTLPVTRKEEREARRPVKSATLDEFIATELSSAPLVEPSIGSTIVSGGRRNMSQRERDEQAERRAYEEAHFVRLPKESKKQRAKKGDRSRDGGFGGEEWRNLRAGLDRIEKLTQKKSVTSGGLVRSRKRVIEDGPRDSGEQAGTRFAKRHRTVTRHLK
jgi:U3 small nucleolar ribonucleoprotein protein LCP5